MPKKLTQEEYLANCINAHGSTYNLERIVYRGTMSKVTVGCPIHDWFEVKAGSFMRGTGCAKCAADKRGLNRRLSEGEFLSRSVARHGQDYGYQFVNYVKTDVKVKILCNRCECTFEMTPECHMAGQGCRDCGYEKNGLNKRSKFEEFVKASREHHGQKFNYDGVDWRGNKQSIELFCPVHQEYFTTTPALHAKGADCPKCAKQRGGLKNRSNTEKFVKDGTEKFGTRFDYSEVDYIKSNLKVKIRCVTHNKWLSVTPNMHLAGFGGCADCAKEATSERCKKSTERFVLDATKEHGSRYGYDRSIYNGAYNKVEIHCREHGYFWQSAGAHIAGRGCSKCGNNGYKVNKSGYLYVLYDGELTKVGITNRNPEIRCKFIAKKSERPFEVLKFYHFDDGGVPLSLETKLLSELWQTYKSPTEKFSGYTECFYHVDQAALLNRIESLIKEQHSSYSASPEA